MEQGNRDALNDSAHLELTSVRKRYGNREVVAGIDLAVARGELLCLLGPSGCGKTTTLNLIAGFVAIDEGAIAVDGNAVHHLPPYRRNMGMVFQSYALFPHLTAFENIAFGLRLRKLTAEAIHAKVSRALTLTHLEGFERHYPRQLSGGQQQRVALARALVIEPTVLLLDEPFSNLDAKLRRQMREEVREIQQRVGITTIFVTHDQEEALAISDRIAVMSDGRIEGLGTPLEIYHRPRNSFVAGFVGDVNVIPSADDRDGTLFLRPEALRVRADTGGVTSALTGTVAAVSFLGARLRYRIRCERIADEIVAEVASSGELAFQIGDRVVVEWEAADATRLGHA